MCQNFGLCKIVDKQTHGKKIIDKVFVNIPDVFVATVTKSTMKTKHKAIHVRPIFYAPETVIRRRKVQIFDLRAHNIDALRYSIAMQDWNSVLQCDDIDVAYDVFLSTINQLVQRCIPVKYVTMGPKDPDFITPLVKSLLRRRNKLRNKGRISEADDLAVKINKLITDKQMRKLNKLTLAGTRELWAAVKKTAVSANMSENDILSDPDKVNEYFANICTTDTYDINEVEKYRSALEIDDVKPHVSDYDVEFLLRTVKRTAAGCDNLPAWLFRECSVELSSIVAHILNYSFSVGKLPRQWLCAIVTPVPKITKPLQLSDFRPISVTPILSRISERIIAKSWIQPVIASSLQDQYAFKPSGSTTAALVHFTHRASEMLNDNHYVRCLMVDFSRAFDTVDHSVLMSKLIKFDIPQSVVNWVCSFLTGRSQVCKVNGILSESRRINRSIVQGSGIGPTLYVIVESNLKPLSSQNDIFKFADDTNLLVPENSDVGIEIEFNHVKDWAILNKLHINVEKTKEIVLRRPRPYNCAVLLPPPLDGVEQVYVAKLLGIIY